MMGRITNMALGFVLIFVGVELNMVETFVLTPRFSNLLAEYSSNNSNPNPIVQTANNVNYNSPYYQASFPQVTQPVNTRPVSFGFNGPKTVTPPAWLCWPVLFLGAVVFLHGFSRGR